MTDAEHIHKVVEAHLAKFTDHYECYECCETFPETTEIETCPLCGSHHVSERHDTIEANDNNDAYRKTNFKL